MKAGVRTEIIQPEVHATIELTPEEWATLEEALRSASGADKVTLIREVRPSIVARANLTRLQQLPGGSTSESRSNEGVSIEIVPPPETKP